MPLPPVGTDVYGRSRSTRTRFWQAACQPGMELNTLVRYCDRVIQWLPQNHDSGAMFAEIDNPRKEAITEGEVFRCPRQLYLPSTRTHFHTSLWPAQHGRGESKLNQNPFRSG
jgi:hypothetical protein